MRKCGLIINRMLNAYYITTQYVTYFKRLHIGSLNKKYQKKSYKPIDMIEIVAIIMLFKM